MLVNMKEILELADEGGFAVGAFNTPNLETLRAVMEAAEEENMPVILNHAEAHQSIIDINVIGPLMVEYAKNAKVPVCVNLDHGTDIQYCFDAIKLGFTGIMFDQSAKPYDINVKETAEFVKTAHMLGIAVEAELGEIPGKEGVGEVSFGDDEEATGSYTDVEQAEQFVRDTGVDALAISIGSVHCRRKDEVHVTLDIERLKEIKGVVGDCKLVMHGGSGVSDDQIKLAVQNGIRKINYYTYMGTSPTAEIVKLIKETPGMLYYHDIANLAQETMKEQCKAAIQLFKG